MLREVVADVDKDTESARAVARGRVLVATAVVVGLHLAFTDADQVDLQHFIGFVSMPAAVMLALWADRARPEPLALLGGAIDVTAVAAAMVAFPAAAETMAAALIIPILLAAFTGGVLVGLAVSVAALGSVMVGSATDEFVLRPALVPALMLGAVIALSVAARADVVRSRYALGAQRSREREDAVVGHAPVPIVVATSGGAISKCNVAAERAFGGLAGKRCHEVLRLARNGERLDCSKRCALATVGSQSAEVTHERLDASTVALLATVAVVPDDEGRDAYVHTFQDITRLKLADEAKTLFLATATHELKTPLTVIRGFLGTISRPGLDPALIDEAIGVMKKRADELSSIVERLLLASRIESGHIDIETSNIDLVPVVRERIDALAAATKRMIALTAPPAAHAVADATSIATIVDHLLENACKYSEATTPIEVTISPAENTVELSVRDAGVGMSADDAHRCFDRFWQADPSARRAVGGTGIGLYIVRSLVESLGGRVSVASELGAGTTFTVGLPTEQPQPQRIDTREPVREASIVREFMRQIGVPQRRPQP